MSTTPQFANSVRSRRLTQGWSQQELADRSGLSRAGVSAIEAGRLTPSVAAALALGRALGCTVEQLFSPAEAIPTGPKWAFPPQSLGRPYWKARVGEQVWAYPVEDESPRLDWHDGVYRDEKNLDTSRDTILDADKSLAERTLVIACCDPASSLLAAEYARRSPFRMIVLQRGSREALRLLAAGKVHLAGVHLAHGAQAAGNARAARAIAGDGCRLVHVARWEEGLALSSRIKTKRIAELLRSRARWVGREEGSGARECQNQVLGDRPAPRRVATDHRAVTTAIRSDWADVGPCVRLVSEESGLRFLKVEEKNYDLCFSAAHESDPRVVALLSTLRSTHYRERLAELPGYRTQRTGELL